MNSRSRFLVITFATVVGVGVTAALGVWQFGRAAEKEALHAQMKQQTALPAINNTLVLFPSDASTLLHRQAALTGTWLPQHTVFLDNRQMDGKPGFFVITPLELAEQTSDEKKIILVQRGWVPRHFLDRSFVPSVPTSSGLVTVTGRIAPLPSKLYEFKGAETSDTGQIRQNIDVTAFAKEIQRSLLNVSLLQTDTPAVLPAVAASDGLLRHWPQPIYGVEKHYGYMVQWWLLSALIAILYTWFQIVQPKLKREIKREPKH